MATADPNPTEPEAVVPFRIKFKDGVVLSLHAPDADTARKKARARHEGQIDKCKRDRSGDHG